MGVVCPGVIVRCSEDHDAGGRVAARRWRLHRRAAQEASHGEEQELHEAGVISPAVLVTDYPFSEEFT